MTGIIIILVVVSCISITMLILNLLLGLNNHDLQQLLSVTEATCKAYDDAAAKHNARANKAEKELSEITKLYRDATSRLGRYHRNRGQTVDLFLLFMPLQKNREKSLQYKKIG